MARQMRKKRKLPFFYKFGAPYMSHGKSFYGKKLCILLAPHFIYQKQKTESVYLIVNNNYGPFSETCIFQKFPQPQSPMHKMHKRYHRQPMHRIKNLRKRKIEAIYTK